MTLQWHDEANNDDINSCMYAICIILLLLIKSLVKLPANGLFVISDGV